MFQKNEFKAEIVRKGKSVESVARDLGIDPVSLYRKMNGNSDFYRKEILQLAKLLNLSSDDIIRIFFT